MLFNSPEFLLCFLPIVLVGFAVLGRFGRNAVVSGLALASLVFYAYWRPKLLVVLVGSIAINFLCARLIWRLRGRSRAQRICMIAGIAGDLGILAFFKYLFPVLHFFNTPSLFHIAAVTLPLGISFFTFTQIGYLIDLAQDAAEPQDFIGYVLFVTFFPHLIAGPILHHREIMPQFAPMRRFHLDWADLALGMSWFVMGLAKKVLLADRLAPFADSAFAHTAHLSASAAWLGLLCYSMQLYFDFSGYSDMAIGLARMLSIRFPLNFDSPYKAANIIDFWSRWHMTLTRYFTLYLYNPFSLYINRRWVASGRAGSRAALRTPAGFTALLAVPTIVTMLLIGVWHGAGRQFLVFGLVHAVYLVINHAWRVFRRQGSLLFKVFSWRPACIALTYLAVLVGQVFFRADSLTGAVQMLQALAGVGARNLPGILQPGWGACLCLILAPVIWLFPNTQELLGQVTRARANILSGSPLERWQPGYSWALALGLTSVAVLWFLGDSSAFLYFQF